MGDQCRWKEFTGKEKFKNPSHKLKRTLSLFMRWVRAMGARRDGFQLFERLFGFGVGGVDAKRVLELANGARAIAASSQDIGQAASCGGVPGIQLHEPFIAGNRVVVLSARSEHPPEIAE